MQKWEYKDLDISYGKGGRYCISSIDGSDLNHWENGENFSVILNQLGDEGWELVTSWGPPDRSATIPHVNHLILKRPKA